MGRYQLAIAVKEHEYMRRLADYVRDSPFGKQWQVAAFTNAEACKRYAQQGYTIDLIAAEPALLDQLKDDFSAIPSVALVSMLGGDEREHELLQYQPLPLLLQGLADFHEQSIRNGYQAAEVIAPGSNARVIAVHSASGGVGKTALSLHLVHAAGSLGHRTFYLNLERWNAADTWLGEPTAASADGEGMSELLYGIKAQSEQSDRWLKTHRKRHPLLKGDYISACSNAEDRLTLSSEDGAALIDIIARSGQYDLIVIDLDDALQELHTAVLERSDHVLWVVTDDSSVYRKHMQAMQYGQLKWGDRFKHILRRAAIVRNRVCAEQIPMLTDIPKLKAAPITLPEVAEWRSAEAVSLLSSPPFRAAAGRLLKHLLGEGSSGHADR